MPIRIGPLAFCAHAVSGHTAAPPSSVVNSRRRISSTDFARLLALVPNIDRKLPVGADLLPYHDVFTGDLLRCRALGLEGESADLPRRSGPQCLHVESNKFWIVNLLRHALPHHLDGRSAFH